VLAMRFAGGDEVRRLPKEVKVFFILFRDIFLVGFQETTTIRSLRSTSGIRSSRTTFGTSPIGQWQSEYGSSPDEGKGHGDIAKAADYLINSGADYDESS
jgi:hypothetical protein